MNCEGSRTRGTGKFESISLQRRVCEPSVPQRRSGTEGSNPVPLQRRVRRTSNLLSPGIFSARRAHLGSGMVRFRRVLARPNGRPRSSLRLVGLGPLSLPRARARICAGAGGAVRMSPTLCAARLRRSGSACGRSRRPTQSATRHCCRRVDPPRPRRA